MIPIKGFISIQNELVPSGDGFEWKLVLTTERGKTVVGPPVNHNPEGLHKRRIKARRAKQARKLHWKNKK